MLQLPEIRVPKRGIVLPPRRMPRWVRRRESVFPWQAAITQTALTSGSSGTNATSVATASISPTANRLVVVKVFGGAVTPANATDPSSVAGAGLTFVKLVSRNNTTSFGLNVSMWYAMSASPGSGAVTVTYPNSQDLFIWSVSEYAGVNTTGVNGANAIVAANIATNQDLTGTAATITATLPNAFGSANNGVISALVWGITTPTPATCTPDTGWTEEHDLGLLSGTISFALETQWRASNDSTAAGTWSANGAMQIVAAELVAATVAGVPFFMQGDLLHGYKQGVGGGFQ